MNANDFSFLKVTKTVVGALGDDGLRMGRPTGDNL
jgi:hypothetical protein